MTRALIIAGGEGITPDRMRSLAAGADLVVAADSGIVTARRMGIEPALVVGDFDSTPAAWIETIPLEHRHVDVKQADTDLAKALRFVVGRGIRVADLTAVTGSRLDHTVNAMGLVLRYRTQIEVCIHDGGGWASLARESPLLLDGEIGDRVSFIPAPAAFGLQSEGLLYSLREFDLLLGGGDAISNEIISIPASVQWKSGSFFIYRQLRPGHASTTR